MYACVWLSALFMLPRTLIVLDRCLVKFYHVHPPLPPLPITVRNICPCPLLVHYFALTFMPYLSKSVLSDLIGFRVKLVLGLKRY